jgi:hypothetical protein
MWFWVPIRHTGFHKADLKLKKLYYNTTAVGFVILDLELFGAVPWLGSENYRDGSGSLYYKYFCKTVLNIYKKMDKSI